MLFKNIFTFALNNYTAIHMCIYSVHKNKYKCLIKKLIYSMQNIGSHKFTIIQFSSKNEKNNCISLDYES